MQVVTVGKQFTFSASHQLHHHNGQCQRLHGHTYKLEVTVTGKIKDPNGDSDEGMVIDFTRIKDAYQQFIEPHVEHQHLNESLEGKVPMTDVEDMRVPLTSCENIARWMYGELKSALVPIGALPGTSFLRVKLWESPTSFAKVPADRNGLDHG